MNETPSRTAWQSVGEVGKEVFGGLLDLVYPPVCLLCGAWMEAGTLCQVCIASFVPLAPPFCDRCGMLIEGGLQVCESCARGPEPPFAWSQVLGRYGGALRDAIHLFKYEGKTALAQPLGSLLARSLDMPPSPLLTSTLGASLTFAAVVPVPLHPSRLRQRGFNQAEHLARVVAVERGWPLDTIGVTRVRKTQTQTTLTGSQRTENVRGAFACRSPQRYAGQSVLIIDDVLTTTATIKEVARVLNEAGASRVCVIALARGI